MANCPNTFELLAEIKYIIKKSFFKKKKSKKKLQYQYNSGIKE